MATQQERRDNTRQRILAAAHRLFIERGYLHTSIGDIQAEATVSRGAIYHHFAAKEDIFAAVFIEVSADAVRRAITRIPLGLTPLDTLIAGCAWWLAAIDDPATRQILLIDGPAILGWERARSLEETTSLRATRTAVQRAVTAGELPIKSIELAAKLINATLSEAALSIQPGNRAARRRAQLLITAMIRGLMIIGEPVTGTTR